MTFYAKFNFLNPACENVHSKQV